MRPIANSMAAAEATMASVQIAYFHAARAGIELMRDYRGVQLPGVSGPNYRFGPFLVDRVSYRVLRYYRVIDRGRVIEAARRTDGSLRAVAAELDVPLAVVGSYQRNGDQVRITSRIVSVRNGEALADAKVDGALQSIFELQDRVV